MPDFKPFRGGSGALNLTLELEGFKQLVNGLDQLPIKVGQEFGHSLRRWAEEVMTNSKQLVPVRTGHLRDTGEISGPEFKGGAWEVSLGYGDKRAWYAAIVHERLDVRHPTGQAKYLEQPINENLPRVDQMLQDAIERAIGVALKAAA